MSIIPDTDVFRSIQKGDHKAFSQLFDSYYISLCFFAARYLHDLSLARSLVQDLFIDLWQRREKIEVAVSVKAYLYISVKNRCIDYLRAKRPEVGITEPEAAVSQVPFRDLIEEAELNERINLSINRLPDKCREIFLLSRMEGLKYAEIARKLDLSVKTVEMQMGIALRKIRESLSDYLTLLLIAFFCKKLFMLLQGVL
ncbi:MAG TPA: RNA polymerase sigma-70 factor [Bacteroidales bacterium]|jgi:RNA polymerase sigma-70 factor (ECF subfamily)|nr:RNA polymerase sigma-70 factor [Bacteroidales bacterium]